MTTLNVYLIFNGNCEEAFNFYRTVFKGEFQTVSRYKDMPPDGGKTLSSAEGEKLMHISLPISKETFLMGSDAGGDWAPNYKAGNNFSLSVNSGTREEADKLYKELSAKGTSTMPMAVTFWGSYFGMLTDRFGINWMISVEDNVKK
jgi:PhnB protein